MILVGVILFQSGIFPFSIVGTSTLSLTQAQLQSNNPYLDGKTWLLTFTSGGLGQRYYGTFTPQDVQDYTSDGSTTTKTFSIDVNYDDQVWNYPIIQTSYNKPIYDIKVVKWTYVPFIDPCSSEEAKSRGLSNVLWYVKPSLSVTCYGIGYNTQSPIGNIGNPTLTSSYEIKVSTPDGTATKTIDINSGSTQGSIGDFAYAIWQGNLGSGVEFPSQSAYKTAYVNGYWRTIRSSYYNTYLNLVSQTPPSTTSSLEQWIDNLKSSVINAKLSTSFGNINSATSLNNALIKITTTTPIQFPVTTLYIKADTIGIYTPTPEIRLFSPNSDCFQTGEQGSISVGLENVGEEYGTWNIYVECEDPFSSTRNIQVSLDSGEKVTRFIPISATSISETYGSCTIFAEGASGTKSIDVDTCVKPQITCTPNSRFCSIYGNNEVVKLCSSNGATSQIIETCPIGTYCEEAECKTGEKPTEEGFFSRIISSITNFFSNLFSGTLSFFEIIRIILVGIVFLFSLLFGKDLFSGFKVFRTKQGLAWIPSIILSGLLAWLVYISFWIGLILFIIYLLFRFLVGGKIKLIKGAFK